MRISLSDPRLSQAERRFLRDVAEKLRPPYHLATARRLNKHLEIAAKATEIAGSLPRQHEREPSPTRNVTFSNPFEQVDPNRSGPFEMIPLHANTMNIVGLAYDRPRMAGERRMLFGTLTVDRDSRTVGKVFFAGHQERLRL